MNIPIQFPPLLNIESAGISFRFADAGGPAAELKSDCEQYEHHSKLMMLAFEAKDDAALKEHWGAVETIKNKYGGLPPSK